MEVVLLNPQDEYDRKTIKHFIHQQVCQYYNFNAFMSAMMDPKKSETETYCGYILPYFGQKVTDKIAVTKFQIWCSQSPSKVLSKYMLDVRKG